MDENEEGEEESGEEEEEEEEEEGEEEEVVEEEEKQDLESELSRVSFEELYEGAVSLGVFPTETVPKVRKRREHGVITEEHLKEISQELGLIKLCWPEVPSVDFEGRVHYPLSYTQNTKKEKLLLWYAENFRQQINNSYPERRPLLIACDNECKIQKMVCTTIRPTTIKFPEFQTWQGCASFVAEHLTYEQLDSPTVLPDRINSPQTVLRRQNGHSFEYATLLASFLIGSAYNAYVVSGYATREVCEKNQTRVDCPYLPEIPEYKSGKEKEKEREKEREKQKEKEKEKEKQKEKEKNKEREIENENEKDKEKEKEGPKYFLKKPIELESQFLLEMEAREIQKQKEAEKAQELAELEAIEEFEKPRYDHLWGWRLHSWVLILPSKDVTRPIFIETTTGIAKSIDDPEYHGIESLWNHQNYWVLVQFQTKTESCQGISFDLNNPKHWERLLIGEPITFRRVPSRVMDLDADDYKRACIEAEKHLDMPTSWVDILQLPHSVFEARYPRARKIIHYRKAMAELFSPYAQSDGLMERVTFFDDYFRTDPLEIREIYANREDHMYFCQKLVRESAILEKFERGREDGLREHYYYANNSGIEVRFTLLFYHDARLDSACKLVMDPLYMDIYFEERKDFLYYLHVDFEKRVNYEQPFRAIRKITVKYHRNPDKEAAKDIAIVEFLLVEKKLQIKFHYEPEHLTQNQRTFLKPSFMEKGAQLIFDPSLTYGYLTGPNVPTPKPLYLYRLELEYFKEEEILEKKIRDRENELFSLLRLRAQELASPRLRVSEFDVERNVDAKKAFKDKEQQKKDMEERDMDMSCDFLAPYYTKYGYKPKSVLPKKDATKVLEECLQDWKSLLVARANQLQRQFEQACQDFQDKNDWYEVNQSTITKEQEEEYFEYCKTNSYLLHLLEVRLIRHKEMAPRRYMIINSYLKSDPRLAQAFQKPTTRPKERQ